MSGTKTIDLPLGDGKASVTITRGFKSWFSTKEAGLTVESTAAVSITCNQSTNDITDAGGAAGVLAEALAMDGASQMGLHLDQFAGEISSGLGVPSTAGRMPVQEPAEPPRRSEKKRRY